MGVSVRQKTKDGPWYVFIRHNNKRTSKQVGDKRDAIKIAREVRAAMAAGDLRLFEAPVPVGPTFADFAEEFLKRSAVDLKHSTLTDYRSVVKQRLSAHRQYELCAHENQCEKLHFRGLLRNSSSRNAFNICEK